MAINSVVALAVVVAVISTAAADTSRSVNHSGEQCPKQGLCPFVRRLVTDVHPVPPPVTAVLPNPSYVHPVLPVNGIPVVYPAHPSHHGSPVSYHGSPVSYHGSPVSYHGSPVSHPSPDFYYPHHVVRRDTPHTQASVCGNLCTKDYECPGTKKCCATECGYSCFDPVHLAH